MANYDTNVKDIAVGDKLVEVKFYSFGDGAHIGREYEIVKITKTRVIMSATNQDGSTSIKRLVVNNYGEIVFEEGRKESRYHDGSYRLVGSEQHLRAVESNKVRDLKSAALGAAKYFTERKNDPAALNIAIEKMTALQDYYKTQGTDIG